MRPWAALLAVAWAAAASDPKINGPGGPAAAVASYRGNASGSAGAASGGRPPPFQPLPPDSEASTEDFPQEPPIDLEPVGNPPPGPSLAGGPMTTETTAVHLQRAFWSISGHDLTVAKHDGSYMFATTGDVFTMTQRTHVYEALTGRRIAEVVSPVWSWHTTYELLTYEPVCPSQQPYETADGLPLYSFARLTQWFTWFYPEWTLFRYKCDGSVEQVWDIKTRYWFSSRWQLDFKESKAGKPVGSFDQRYYVSFDEYYDAWITKGEDLTLFALTGLMLDMNIVDDDDDDSAKAQSFLKADANATRK